MSVQTNPKEIARTLDHAVTADSRARMLRMIERLQRQHEAKLRKAIMNERLTAYLAAKHRHASPNLLGVFRQRLIEAGGDVHVGAEAHMTIDGGRR